METRGDGAAVQEPKEPESEHLLVRKTRRAFSTSRVDRDGFLLANDRDHLNLAVSQGTFERSLQIFGQLIYLLAARGMKVQVPGTFVVANERKIFLRIREGRRQTTHKPTPAERAEMRRSAYHFVPKFDVAPNGLLAIQITDQKFSTRSHLGGARTEWNDGKRGKIEAKLELIPDAIVEAARAVVEREERFREAQRRREEEQERRWELERKREEERKRRTALEEEAGAWRRSKLIHEYVDAARSRALARGPIEDGSELDRWLKWATRTARDLDPLDAGDEPPSPSEESSVDAGEE